MQVRPGMWRPVAVGAALVVVITLFDGAGKVARLNGIDSGEKRRQRADLRSLARPQSGVDDWRAAFPQSKDIPGVVDRKAVAGTASAPSR